MNEKNWHYDIIITSYDLQGCFLYDFNIKHLSCIFSFFFERSKNTYFYHKRGIICQLFTLRFSDIDTLMLSYPTIFNDSFSFSPF